MVIQNLIIIPTWQSAVFVEVLGPFDVVDGCFVTGIAQGFNEMVNGKRNPYIGDAVGPTSAVSTIYVS